MTTLGKTSTGSTTTTSSSNKTVVSTATASGSGTLTAGHLRINIDSGSGTVNMVVYADSSGAPGALLATSDNVSVSNTTMATVDFTFSGANQISIANGTAYWVGASWADPGTPTFTYERDSTASARQESNSTLPNPFGTPTAQAGPIAAYVEFFVLATLPAQPDVYSDPFTLPARLARPLNPAIVLRGALPPPSGAVTDVETSIVTATASVPAAGAAILQNVTSGVRLLLEVAWGADLTDLTGAGWTWTDITADVQLSNGWGIDLQMGATDETAQTQPSQLTAVLDNTAGAYSLGPQSSNYPNVAQNVPVRLRISTNSGSTWTVHYQGNAAAWTPNWDTTGKWATVTLTASGWLRQLNQGTLPVTSAYTYWTLANQDSHLIGYWPLEDGNYATTARSAIGGTAATIIGDGGPQTIGNSNDSGGIFVCTGLMAAGGNFNCPMPSYTNSGTQQIMWLFGETSELVTSGTAYPYISLIYPLTGTIKVWATYVTPGGFWDLKGYSAVTGGGLPSGSTLFDSGSLGFNLLNNPSLMSLTFTTSGSNVNVHMETINAAGTYLDASGTATSVSSGAIGSIAILAPGSVPTDNQACSIGQITLRNSSTALSTYNSALTAYINESVTTRLTRLATDAKVPITIRTDTATETSTNPADTMGPQYVDNLTNLMRECEATGLGRLYDGLNIGLTYITRLLRESQQPLLTVDATQNAIVMPFAPQFDDLNVINQAVVTRRSGSSYTATETASVNSIGLYTTSLTVNQADDTNLSLMAKWVSRANKVIGNAYRYPSWTFALEKQPSLIASWLTCFPSCRVDVSNIGSVRSQHPAGTIRNVLEGWHETISQHRWVVQANTSSYEPWKVITLAAASGTTTDTLGRYESDGSTVAANASVGATSLSVATPSGPLWTTSAVTADDFPLTVAINGYPVTVTAISGASSPQTFTVSALAHAISSGAAVTIYQNAVLGM